MDFGHTNDQSHFDAANAFREAAIADGWQAKATYGKQEAVESHATLERAAFKMHVMVRMMEPGCKWKFCVQINIWGPDGMAIDPPFVYDSDYIVAGVRRCGKCKAKDVETFRAGFANRCCATCLPKVRAEIEKPGWCD